MGCLRPSQPFSHTLPLSTLGIAFDASWVEKTLVRLFDARVQRRMWGLMCHFLRPKWDPLSHTPGQILCIGQSRVLSPLLFIFFVTRLNAAVRRTARGLQLFSGQIYADNFELV